MDLWCTYTAAGLIPAAAAMSRVVVPWKPRSAKAATAASRRRARVPSARAWSAVLVILSSVLAAAAYGTGHPVGG